MYWDGSPFSHLNFISVQSFREYHKDWEIRMWSPVQRTSANSWRSPEQQTKYVGKDYYSNLNELNVTHHTVDFDKIGFMNSASEVIKSDYFRYWVLTEFGGAWSDCDIVYIRSLNGIFPDNTDTVICCNTARRIHYPVGFLMSSKDNTLFKHILSLCKVRYNPSQYQCLGTLLFEAIFPRFDLIKRTFPQLNIVIMDKHYYLPIDWDKLEWIYQGEPPHEVLKTNTFGVHWFNGSAAAKAYQNDMSNGNVFKKCLMYRLIGPYLDASQSIDHDKKTTMERVNAAKIHQLEEARLRRLP